MFIRPQLILTDVDDVVLRWADAFTAYRKGAVDPNLQAIPEGSIHAVHSPARWMGVSEAQGLAFIEEFHLSSHYPALHAHDDALIVLPRLARAGCRFIGITACGLDPATRRARIRNLDAAVGPIFEDVIAVDLGASKRDHLARFAPCVWVEDSVQNAADGAALGHSSFLIDRPANQVPTPEGVTRVAGWHQIAAALAKPAEAAEIGWAAL